MLKPGPARKVVIHLNEDTAASQDFLYNEVFEFLYAAGVSGATLVRPAAGFGFHHRMHELESSRSAAEHMPVRIEFIDTPEKVESVLAQLCSLVSDGVVEMHDTYIVKAAAGKAGPD